LWAPCCIRRVTGCAPRPGAGEPLTSRLTPAARQMVAGSCTG
jgi:hypothetical protein